jgi:hypothetical protein
MLPIIKPLVLEYLVIVVVVGDDKYVLGRRFNRWLHQRRETAIARIFDSIGAQTPREFQVSGTGGLSKGTTTCYVFWFIDHLEEVPNRELLRTLDECKPRRVDAINKAYDVLCRSIAA